MTEAERLEAIREAMELVREAKEMVDDAMSSEDGEGYYLAYGRCGFDQLLGNGNPYDQSLQKLLDDAAEMEAEEQEEPDDQEEQEERDD